MSCKDALRPCPPDPTGGQQISVQTPDDGNPVEVFSTPLAPGEAVTIEIFAAGQGPLTAASNVVLGQFARSPAGVLASAFPIPSSLVTSGAGAGATLLFDAGGQRVLYLLSSTPGEAIDWNVDVKLVRKP